VGGGRILRKNSSHSPGCPQVGKPVPLSYIRYYVTYLLVHLSSSGLLLQIFVVEYFWLFFYCFITVLSTGNVLTYGGLLRYIHRSGSVKSPPRACVAEIRTGDLACGGQGR
jgi:hypothetical protein